MRCFKLDGVDCWFWSDDHDPPHFHAKRAGKWEVKARFLLPAAEMIETLWGKTAGDAALRRLVKLAEQHRAELLAEWEASGDRP